MNEKRQKAPMDGVRLIALDMDGTLLNSRQKISDENAAALRRAHEKGIRIAIVSGRAPVEIEWITNAALPEIPLYIVGLNGAYVRGSDGNDSVIYLGAEIFRECVRLAEKDDCRYFFYTVSGLYSNRPNYEYRPALPMRPAARSEARRYAQNVVKFGVSTRNQENLAALRKEISAMDVSVGSSSDHNFEVNARGIDKGNALRLLTEKLGIPQESVLAAGDQENDLPMLKWAGIPVVMANAAEALLDFDAYRTGHHDESGIAHALDHFIW